MQNNIELYIFKAFKQRLYKCSLKLLLLSYDLTGSILLLR